jgi:hypothetical protein
MPGPAHRIQCGLLGKWLQPGSELRRDARLDRLVNVVDPIVPARIGALPPGPTSRSCAHCSPRNVHAPWTSVVPTAREQGVELDEHPVRVNTNRRLAASRCGGDAYHCRALRRNERPASAIRPASGACRRAPSLARDAALVAHTIDDRVLVQFGFIGEDISVRRNRGSVSGQRSSVWPERLPGHRRLPASSLDGGSRAGYSTACATVTRSRSLATAGLPYSW